MLKGEWGAERKGKLPHLFIPSKTATLVPEFVVKDLPLGRTLVMMMITVIPVEVSNLQGFGDYKVYRVKLK